MPTQTAKLEFANKFYGTVTESAANTLTFSEIQTAVDIFSKAAWVLVRLEWYLTVAQFGLLVDDGDALQMSLTASDKMSDISLSDPGVIDSLTLHKRVATVVGINYHAQPITRDFSNLPSGGIIIVPRPLFVAVKGTGLASAGGASCRGYFSRVELKADEYIELVDFYRMVS